MYIYMCVCVSICIYVYVYIYIFFNLIILEYKFALEQQGNLMSSSLAPGITTHDSACYIYN